MFATQGDSVKQGELMPLPDDQLYGFMEAVKQSDPTQFIALHADQEVPYGKIVDILDKGAADADLPWEAFTFESFR